MASHLPIEAWRKQVIASDPDDGQPAADVTLSVKNYEYYTHNRCYGAHTKRLFGFIRRRGWPVPNRLRNASLERYRLCPAVSHYLHDDTRASGALAVDGDLLRIPTKLCNMPLNPFECSALVEQACVKVTISLYGRSAEKAEDI